MKRYKLDKKVELSAWILASLLLIIFVPRNKIREANVAFLFKQIITWVFGLIVVEKNLIKYPYRLFFKKSNKTSFTFEYFVYPSICALFNVNYPEKGNSFVKVIYYTFYSSIITLFEILTLKYTKLIKYKNWHWYYTFSTLWTTFYLSRIYHRWFFRIKS